MTICRFAWKLLNLWKTLLTFAITFEEKRFFVLHFIRHIFKHIKCVLYPPHLQLFYLRIICEISTTVLLYANVYICVSYCFILTVEIHRKACVINTITRIKRVAVKLRFQLFFIKHFNKTRHIVYVIKYFQSNLTY